MNAPPDTGTGPSKPAARRIARLAFWLGAFLAPFAFIAFFDALIAQNARPAVTNVGEADVQSADVASPAALDASAWKHVRLGYVVRPGAGETASLWFRLRVEAGAAPDGLWSVYLPRPYANVAVFVNGELIGDGGEMTAPLPMHREPLRFTFPAKLLNASANGVLVRVVANTSVVGLGRVYIAPAAELERAYQFGRLMFYTLKQVLVVMMCVVAFIMGAMYFMRRRDSAYGWFALALITWAVHIQVMLTQRAPFDARSLWESIQGVAIGLYPLFAAMFTHRFLGMRRPRLEKAFLVFAVLGSVILMSGPLIVHRPLTGFFLAVWIPVVQVIGIYQLVLMLRATQRQPEFELRMLAAASWLMFVVGERDALIDSGLLPSASLYLTYTAAPVILVFGAILLRRFVNALDSSERANEVLEGRVAEKSRELELNLGRLNDMERERALSAERERIMQDMHDGIGGHLVQALSIVTARTELAPVEEPLRTCLDELRIMIDSIEPANGDLASVLGTLRMRMSRRLAQAGVDMHWQVGDLPPLPDLGPKHVLEITRIVQEAITNSLKHSGARCIRISANRLDAARVRVEIGDDGRGIGAIRGDGTGRGIAGMRRRAATLGGQLDITSAASGTTVSLELPLTRATSKDPATPQAREPGQATAPVHAQSAALE